MLIRIVRMYFQADKVQEFLEIFENAKKTIRSFEGCRYLELWQDIHSPNVFCSYSHWESEEHLEKYRHSEFFRNTWSKMKILFEKKPYAFSVKVHQVVSED
ncbi:MAG: antibiotic biosynthesis monooxygenase family protein [Raineya sp.]|nr:antibiotic biosynthesis monooxygenase family protein [Raineya sp.]